MKINNKINLHNCSLQSEMILHKCWAASKYKLPHLSGKPVFCETQPAHYNTARTSCSQARHILYVLCLPISLQGLGNLPECWAELYSSFPEQELWNVLFLTWKSTGPSCCSIPPPDSALYSPKPDEEIPSLQHPQLSACTQACMPCGQSPNSRGPEKQQLENGGQKARFWLDQGRIFSFSSSSLLETPRSLSSELPEPLRLFLSRQIKFLFSSDGHFSYMQVIWEIHIS